LCEYGNLDFVFSAKSIFGQEKSFNQYGTSITARGPDGRTSNAGLSTHCVINGTPIIATIKVNAVIEYEKSIRPGARHVDNLVMDIPVTIHCQ
jgi:hypothetical protein